MQQFTIASEGVRGQRDVATDLRENVNLVQQQLVLGIVQLSDWKARHEQNECWKNEVRNVLSFETIFSN